MSGKFIGPGTRDDYSAWDIEAVVAQLSFLQGEVLTVVDSALPDGRQLKATKDLVKGAFRNRERYMREISAPIQANWIDGKSPIVQAFERFARGLKGISPHAALSVSPDVELALRDYYLSERVFYPSASFQDGRTGHVFFDMPTLTDASLAPETIQAWLDVPLAGLAFPSVT